MDKHWLVLFSLFKILLLVYVYVRESEDNSVDSDLSFYLYMSPGDRTRVAGLQSKHSYQLNHLASP